jgi:hypothetical protein
VNDVENSAGKYIVDDATGDNYLARLTYKTSLKGSVEQTLDSDGTFTLDTAGNYKVTISAYDAYGNKASSKAIKVMIDDAAPDITQAVIKANGRVVEQDGIIYAVGGKLKTFSIKAGKQSSKVTPEWKIGNGAWVKKHSSTDVKTGDTVWIRLSNAAGVVTEEQFAKVEVVAAAPVDVVVKLGSLTATEYGNTVTKAGAITISYKAAKNTAYELKYILTESANVPADDENWLTYTPKAKPVLSKNMKAVLHIKLIANGEVTARKAVPFKVELSEKAEFPLVAWLTGWFGNEG